MSQEGAESATVLENPMQSNDEQNIVANDELDDAGIGPKATVTEQAEFAPSLILYHLFEDPSWFDQMGTLKGAPFKLAATIIIWTINVLIIISTFAFCIETYSTYSTDPHRNPENHAEWKDFWLGVEILCVACFTIDLLARFAGAVIGGAIPEYQLEDPDGKIKEAKAAVGESFYEPKTYAAKFMSDPMNYIDVTAIFPFYIKFLVDDFPDLRFLRVIRLVRILKSLPGAKHGNMIHLITKIVTGSAGALMIPCYFMSLAMIVLAAVEYYAEMTSEQVCTQLDGTTVRDWDSSRLKNPGCMKEHGCVCSGTLSYIVHDGTEYSDEMYASIPDTVWWCIVSFTTVGYGDLYPRTPRGRWIGILTMFTGVFFLAMPISIVGNSFESAWKGYTAQRSANIKAEKVIEVQHALAEASDAASKHKILVSLLRDRQELDTKHYTHDQIEVLNTEIGVYLAAAKKQLEDIVQLAEQEPGKVDKPETWTKALNGVVSAEKDWSNVYSMLSSNYAK